LEATPTVRQRDPLPLLRTRHGQRRWQREQGLVPRAARWNVVLRRDGSVLVKCDRSRITFHVLRL
jgi:hypothetical protein